MEKLLTVDSLFSGCGGMGLGLMSEFAFLENKYQGAIILLETPLNFLLFDYSNGRKNNKRREYMNKKQRRYEASDSMGKDK